MRFEVLFSPKLTLKYATLASEFGTEQTLAQLKSQIKIKSTVAIIHYANMKLSDVTIAYLPTQRKLRCFSIWRTSRSTLPIGR